MKTNYCYFTFSGFYSRCAMVDGLVHFLCISNHG